MGPIEARINQKISNELGPVHLAIENESAKHGFSRGHEGHFKVLIVSDVFEGLRTLERHQKIYSILKDELTSGVHALAIRALTPAEFTKQGGSFESPECAHAKRN